jgi:hypothetical protein
MVSEKTIQQTAIQMIKVLYPDIVIVASQNGIDLSKLSTKDRATLVREEKKMGLEKGASDIALYLPEGITLHLEFKTEVGKQSKEQKDMQKRLEYLDHHYYVVRSVKEVFDCIAIGTSSYYRTECLDKAKTNTTYDPNVLRGYYGLC